MLARRAFRMPWRQIQSGATHNPRAPSSRSLTTTTLTRPSIFPQSALCQCQSLIPSASGSAVSEATMLQPEPIFKISDHPALQSTQVRNAPRNTMNRPSHLVRKRRSGFLARLRSRTGRNILIRRRQKRRSKLSH